MTSDGSGPAGRVADLVARYYLRKPDQAGLLRIKFPDLGSLAWAVLNEAAYRLGRRRSARLTTLNVEVTNRCNLRCVYCPVNRSMARPRTDLPFETFRRLIERSPTVRTLLPFQWGEPLLHPRLFDMVRLAAGRGVRTFVTTNGTLLDDVTCRAIVGSGIHRLTVSVDGDDAIHRRTRGIELAPVRERVQRLRRLRDAAGAPLRIDVSMVVDETTAPGLDAFFAAWSPVVDRVQAIPRMVRETRRSPCREPWRGLLVVLADGRVTTCCADSEGTLALGDVHTEDPPTIFQGEAMRALRRDHARKCFPAACAECGEFRHPRVSPRFQ